MFKKDTIAKKLTEEQIKRLYTFTRKHFVDYYDLQTELTDHLANAIEARWQQQPGLSFDDALQQEFKKFGIFGFMTVVEQRQLALTKKYYKLFWGYFKDFFRLPKVIISVLAMAALYKVAKIIDVIIPILVTLIIILSLGRSIYINYKYKKQVKQTGKRWMFEDIIYKAGGMGLSFVIPFQLNSHVTAIDTHSSLVIGIFSVWTVLFALYEYVIFFIIPARAKEHLKHTYPEYALEISE
jgi:hypothetical protein